MVKQAKLIIHHKIQRVRRMTLKSVEYYDYCHMTYLDSH